MLIIAEIPEDEDGVPDEEGGRTPSPEVVVESNEEPTIQPQTQNANYFLNVMNMLPPHLNNFGNNGTNRLQEFLEAQRRLQMNNNKVAENGQKSASQINNEMPSMVFLLFFLIHQTFFIGQNSFPCAVASNSTTRYATKCLSSLSNT